MEELQTSESPSRKRRRVGLIVGLISVPALIYLAAMGLIYFKQTELIFAGMVTQGRPESGIIPPPPWAELLGLKTPEGDRVIAIFAQASHADGSPRPDAASRPTVLYCYGSGQTLRRMIPMVDAFRRDGLNVIVPEYLGYGLSGGKASEAGCLAAAEAAYQHLLDRDEIDSRQIIIEGGSLGAAVAVDLAARHPVAGLVMMSGFTSMTDMSRLKYGWLPVDLLLRHRLDSLSKIGNVSCPILITHGTADELIPFEMSKRLASSATSSVTHLAIPEANHDDTLYLCGPSGALLPTTMKGPHARFTPEVHRTIRRYFAQILGEPTATGFLPVESPARPDRR